MGKTSIEWTDASWNPVVGCKEISPGCANCYAARLAATRLKNHPDYKGLAILENGHARWTGELNTPDRMDEPMHWHKPRRIFVCDMSDLFNESVPVETIAKVFRVMRACKNHTFQVLTKRAGRMREFLTRMKEQEKTFARFGHKNTEDRIWPLPNVWLGVSVENQHFADERIPLLLQTPAAVRFISAEPLLGPVDVTAIRRHHAEGFCRPLDGRFRRIDWVICGGESGPGARPMHADWARSLRDQCQAARVPFFFKQWGEWLPVESQGILSNVKVREYRGGMWRVGKKKAGRLLDGREWNEFPCQK